MSGIVRVPSLPLVLTKADDHFGANDARRGENIDDFQATRFGNAVSGVQTNSKEGAIALQTFVEQKFDFRLGEDFRLPVAFYFHAWCIPDPMLQSLAYLLHCCTSRRGFLNAAVGGELEVSLY